MRAALHDGTEVVNVIEYDPDADWTVPDGLQLVTLDDGDLVGPGWACERDTFVPPERVEPPDVPAFLIAVMGALGKPRGREILSAYPDIHMALREPYNYTIARQGIAEALTDGFLTQTEHGTIMGQWDDHNLPSPGH